MFAKIKAYLALIAVVQLIKFKGVELTAVPELRIMGGAPADIKSFPYLVGISYKEKLLCGGSLITSQCVLTAANCVDGKKPASLKIFTDSTTVNDGTFGEASKLYIHSGYQVETLVDLDVAVIKLVDPLGDETIDIDYVPVEEGDTIAVAGWGRLSEDGQAPTELQAVNLTAISTDKCRDIYNEISYPFINNNNFCTQDEGKDACKGDYGGPAVRNGQQVGILSWGVECGTYPGVYTKLSSDEVKSFVEGIIKDYC